MNSILRRRRAAMGAHKTSNVLFEWDYTEGVSNKIIDVGTIPSTMTQNGLLLESGTVAWSRASIAPSISPLASSYKATITYSDIVSLYSNSSVNFWHYNYEEKLVRLLRQKKYGTTTNFTKFINADSSASEVGWNLSDSGTIIIEYNSQNGTITFTQGANSYTGTITSPTSSSISTAIVSAQTGSNGAKASVVIKHIKIERLQQ